MWTQLNTHEDNRETKENSGKPMQRTDPNPMNMVDVADAVMSQDIPGTSAPPEKSNATSVAAKDISLNSAAAPKLSK